MTTPADQNFDSISDDPIATGVDGPRTLGSFVFEGHATDSSALKTVIYSKAGMNLSIGSGQEIGLNYGAIYTADWWQFRSVSSADNFKMASLQIESTSSGWDDIVTISGLDDGGVVISATVNLTLGGTYGSITYAKLGGAVGGTLTFGAGWSNIDTVRFAGQPGDLYGTQLWLDAIDVSPPPASITSAAYDASSGVFTVSAAGLTAGDSIDASKLTLTGQGGLSYTLTSGTVSAGTSAFSVTLNGADKLAVNGLLNKNLTTAADGTAFNLAGAAGWEVTATSAADATNAITVSNVVAPSITSAAYNAATHVLTVTGANLVGTVGAANDVTVSKLTLTGEGGVTRLLSGASVDVASATSFSVTLSGTDRNLVETMFNKNGTLATDGSTAYSLSAADDWNAAFTGGNTAFTAAPVTVSNVATPAISSASYDAATGVLAVTGTGFLSRSGAANDIVASKLTITGQGGATYTLTGTPDVDISSGTSFTMTMNATDRAALAPLLNMAGTQSSGGMVYNLAFAEDWAAGAAAAVVVADLAGNPITVSNPDTTPPTATIGISASALKIGDSATVTITFSEAVTGFSNADLTVANGTLGAVSSSDGGITWSAAFTPTASVENASNVITLANSGVQDLSGNAGVGTTNSANYAIDTLRPTVSSIVLADSALTAGETTTVTIAFSEAVTGVTNADLTIANGTLGAVSSSDGGITWSATFTPAANVEDASNVITVNNAGANDAAGNAGVGTTNSANYAIDTLRPTVSSIVLADSTLIAGETTTVTITFSEAVTGFTNVDLTIANGTLGAVSSSDGGITWSATFTPAANVEDASNVITVNDAGVSDAAGNAGVGTTNSANYAIDTLRPTVSSVVLADSALIAGETTTVTITFSEAVTGFTNADLTIANGTLGAVSSSDGGVTWSATFTPAANVEDASNVIIVNNAGMSDAAGNAGVGTTNSTSYAIDTLLPTVSSVVLADSALIAGETTTVTITFSEAVTGFTNADLTIANGTLGAVSSSDGGITWSATFTPTASVEDASNVITLANSGVQDLSGNAGLGATNSANYTIDALRPTVTSVVLADSALTAGETTTVTITFSEAVTGFTNADLTIANGTLGAVNSSDGGITWSATFTPAANVEDATNVITVNNAGVSDAAGNAGVDTTNSGNYAIDTLRPTVSSVVLADTALIAGETKMVTITFAEAVTGFTNADLTLANGTLGAVSSSDGGITWSATFTPAANVEDATNVITVNNAGVNDAAGNAGVGTINSANYTIDTLRPSLSSVVLADSALIAGETTTVTITFSEAVTGFTNADLTIANGTLGGVSSSDGGITWSATFTPAANVEDASNVITVNNADVSDAAGNAGVGTTNSANYTIDTLRPTVSSVVLADSALTAGETTTVTITFSEAVTGFTNADLTIANGTLGAVSSSDGGITWNATFTPTASVEDASNVITVNNAGVSDAAGNAGVGTTNSTNYAIDTLLPTVSSVVLADSALTAGETTTVTITFSEAVTGFTNADLTIANGTLGAVSSSDGGITWSATFTPAVNVEDASNVITVNNAGVNDAAGNAGVGTTNSANYAIETLRPTASSIVLANSALAVGETTTVTITFSEAVTGFTNADLAVANGTLGAVSSSDGGITWSTTFTPAANVEDASNVITVNNAGVNDAAGNAGVGTTNSANYAIETLRPTASSIVLANSALAVGETTTVTITFSEAVTRFTNADLAVANGTLGAVSSSDGGITWSTTFTPAANIEDASNVMTVNNAGVSDAAGNAGVGTTNSANYTIDTLRPTVSSIVLADTALIAGETTMVTITFSEAVTAFTNADLTIANGTLGALSSSDGGITWRATFTPTSNVEDATNVITVNNAGVIDAAGNAGAGTTNSANYAIDTLPPTVSSVVLADSALIAGETTMVTITFSEAVTGFTNADLTIANGTLGAPSSSDGGIIWRATFTPAANVEDASNVITINNAGVSDAAGDAGVGITNSANYTIDTLRPSLSSIVLADSALLAGETTTVTITFSEAVSGLTNADLDAANGNLSGLATVDGGITWTAIFTPDPGVSDATNAITLAGAGVADLAGNAGADTTASANYTVCTARPTASISLDDSALAAGERMTVTIVFSEAVTGFTGADLAFANGTLGAFTTSDNVTFSAAFTPAAGITVNSNTITLDNRGVTGASGNVGIGFTHSATYAIDSARPAASITVDNPTLGIGETAAVTITFSEAVTGLALTDLATGAGTLSGLATADGGITWTATLAPHAHTRAGDSITLDTHSVRDLAGNAGDTHAISNQFLVDTGPPLVMVDGAPTTTDIVPDPLTGRDIMILTVPVIVALDPDPLTGAPGIADIPFGATAPAGSTRADLVASLPAGSGMVAEGPTVLLSNTEALADLTHRIDSKTAAGSATQQDMEAEGHGFLGALATGVLLETRTLVLSGAANPPSSGTIVIAGSTDAPPPGGHAAAALALVIDATALAPGAALRLEHIDFAAIVGAATVRGGPGTHHVVGDDAAQNILLGQGDNIVAGGGGNDTLGSAGGADRLDGGSGDDILAGGAGNDVLLGGSGADVLAGGRSDRGAWMFYLDSSGALTAQHQTALFGPAATESVQLSELDPGAAGLRFLGADKAQLGQLALLYQAAFQRAPDLGGLDFFARAGLSAPAAMAAFMASPEWAASGNNALGNAAFVQKMYLQTLGRGADDAGLAFWVGQLDGTQGAPLSRADVLAALALSAEHGARSAGALLVGSGVLAQETGWFGGSGDDRFDGGAGSDLLVGGDGFDTAVYAGKQSDYQLLLGRDGQIRLVDKASGDLDTLRGIEAAAFSDGTLDLAFTQAGAGALRSVGMLYQAVFDRAADLGGIRFWLGQHLDAPQLARAISGTSEFAGRYGTMDDAHFVAALFANSGLNASDAGGMGTWESYLGTHTRVELIASWIGSDSVAGAQFGTQGLWLV